MNKIECPVKMRNTNDQEPQDEDHGTRAQFLAFHGGKVSDGMGSMANDLGKRTHIIFTLRVAWKLLVDTVAIA